MSDPFRQLPPPEVLPPSPKRRGRPVGSESVQIKRKRRNLQILADAEDAPLMTMIANMRFWNNTVVELQAKAMKLLETASKLNEQAAEDERVDINKLIELLSKLFHAREQSERCAVDAAPYVHPKIVPIEAEKEDPDEQDMKVVSKLMSVQESVEFYIETVIKRKKSYALGN